MVYEAGYDYTNLQQRYQFPLDPLVYKSQRHPYTPNIFGDINENLESVSKIDVTLRFANDPLAFFNQKMRGNANSFGSNWVCLLPRSSEAAANTDCLCSLLFRDSTSDIMQVLVSCHFRCVLWACFAVSHF